MQELEVEIDVFHGRFNSMKELTIEGLERCQISVVTVVFILTNVRTVSDNMKVFLRDHHKALRQCEDHLELFGSLNFYWNYLSYDLLDYLIKEMAKKHKFFQTVAGEMGVYKKDLEQFRKRTALVVFCKTESPILDDPPAGFRKMVVRFNWPDKATLNDVENFRKKCARCYDLPTCAMMLANIRSGSFVVCWFIPSQIVEVFRKKRALGVLVEFRVTELMFGVTNDACIYQSSNTSVSEIKWSIIVFNTLPSTVVDVFFSSSGDK